MNPQSIKTLTNMLALLMVADDGMQNNTIPQNRHQRRAMKKRQK